MSNPASPYNPAAIFHPAPANIGGSQSGSGSPEGVVVGDAGDTYFDTVGNVFWVKKTGTGNTGWYQLVGP